MQRISDSRIENLEARETSVTCKFRHVSNERLKSMAKQEDIVYTHEKIRIRSPFGSQVYKDRGEVEKQTGR